MIALLFFSRHTDTLKTPPPLQTRQLSFPWYPRLRSPNPLHHGMLWGGISPGNAGIHEVVYRNDCILKISLVCRRWTVEAVPLMCRKITVTSEKTGKLLPNSRSSGIHQTHYLEIIGRWHHGPSVATSVELIASMQGLRWLRMEGFREEHGLRMDVLSSPNLRCECLLG